MLNKKKNNKGFTLVELLVVIAIIGILAVVAVPALFKNIEKGKVADLESDISAIRSAALSYYAEESNYPNTNAITKSTTITNPTGNDDDAKAKIKATNAILKEVENSGFPFEGSYTLEGTTPGPLELKIDLTTGTKLSEDGAKKLVNDLGKVTSLTLDNGKESDGSDPAGGSIGDGENVNPGEINGKVKKIVVKLMDGTN